MNVNIKAHKLTTAQTIILGYLIVILSGAFLLSLPISNKAGDWTSFIDALFTSTSATCVTGLVVVDTYTHYTLFGQLVTLALIQIGGIGFMTLLSIFGLFLKRKINLQERKIIMQAAGNLQISGVITLVKKIILLTFIFEGIGALLLMTRMIPVLGVKDGIYNSIYISISAFCNAGFDVMLGEYTSLTAFQSDFFFNLITMCLIVFGGLGFLVWSDLFSCKFKFKKLHLHSKIVLFATGFLIIIPAILFIFFEQDYTFKDLPLNVQFTSAFFQSVTSRTAGFNTINLAEMSESSALLTTILMFIGGSPGSTAGGVKTTTIVVLVFSVIYANSKSSHITMGNKRLERNAVKQATSIVVLYVFAIIVGSFVILNMQHDLKIKDVIFECVSAITTTGLSMGITPNLCFVSKFVLILLMFIGRVGALTFILLLKDKDDDGMIKRPTEKILVG